MLLLLAVAAVKPERTTAAINAERPHRHFRLIYTICLKRSQIFMLIAPYFSVNKNIQS
jgi:hypothetical protein